MLTPSQVSACVVTRGDVDLTEIIASLSDFADVNVWDNSVEQDFAVMGRYMAMTRASKRVVYVQDDDCIVDAERVVACYLPGGVIANMPESRWRDYPDCTLVGWGAVFDIVLPEIAFGVWAEHTFSPADEDWLARLDGPWFNRICDLVFTTLMPHRKIDVGFRHLPWAEGPGRMFTADPEGHRLEHEQALRLAREVRDAVG